MAVVSLLGGVEPLDDIALESGFRIAETLGRDLEAISALPDAAAAVVYATSPYMIGVGSGAIEQVREAQRVMVDDWRKLFDTVAGRHPDVVASFDHQAMLTERAAVHRSILADAAVFPRPAGTSGHVLSPAFEAVLLDARLPTILAGTSPYTSDVVAIAWDGSAQAARAVRFHLPLIRAARRVIIAQDPGNIRDGEAGPAASCEALSTWLGDHGVETAVEHVSGDIGPALLGLCETEGAGLMVAGAFGHSRTGEFFFGGASRSFFHAEKAPALALAH